MNLTPNANTAKTLKHMRGVHKIYRGRLSVVLSSVWPLGWETWGVGLPQLSISGPWVVSGRLGPAMFGGLDRFGSSVLEPRVASGRPWVLGFEVWWVVRGVQTTMFFLRKAGLFSRFDGEDSENIAAADVS